MKQDLHHVKRKTLAVQRCFNLFDITYMKTILPVSKTIIIVFFKLEKLFSYK